MPTIDRPPNSEWRDKNFLDLEDALRSSADILMGFDLISPAFRERIIKKLDKRRAEVDSRQTKK